LPVQIVQGYRELREGKLIRFRCRTGHLGGTCWRNNPRLWRRRCGSRSGHWRSARHWLSMESGARAQATFSAKRLKSRSRISAACRPRPTTASQRRRRCVNVQWPVGQGSRRLNPWGWREGSGRSGEEAEFDTVNSPSLSLPQLPTSVVVAFCASAGGGGFAVFWLPYQRIPPAGYYAPSPSTATTWWISSAAAQPLTVKQAEEGICCVQGQSTSPPTTTCWSTQTLCLSNTGILASLS